MKGHGSSNEGVAHQGQSSVQGGGGQERRQGRPQVSEETGALISRQQARTVRPLAGPAFWVAVFLQGPLEVTLSEAVYVTTDDLHLALNPSSSDDCCRALMMLTAQARLAEAGPGRAGAEP